MADPRVPLKNPFLAVGLGLLLPGGGQLYQGRTFKGVLYAVCIVGTFVYGMFLSDWTALYAGNPGGGRRWGFLAQVPIGLPAAYAKIQERRYHALSNVPQDGLEAPIADEFHGVVKLENQNGDLFEIEGHIELRPVQTERGTSAVEGEFTGVFMQWNPETEEFERTENPLELKLSSEVGRFEIDRKIYADSDRSLRIDVVAPDTPDGLQKIGVLRGVVPRSMPNRLGVPVEQEKVQRLHSRLGKTYDLALVYTWIASLLNVLVLWDAFEGPAYGYGDEKPEDDEKDAKKNEKPKSKAS